MYPLEWQKIGHIGKYIANSFSSSHKFTFWYITELLAPESWEEAQIENGRKITQHATRSATGIAVGYHEIRDNKDELRAVVEVLTAVIIAC
jgi:hypothetical protein